MTIVAGGGVAYFRLLFCFGLLGGVGELGKKGNALEALRWRAVVCSCRSANLVRTYSDVLAVPVRLG